MQVEYKREAQDLNLKGNRSDLEGSLKVKEHVFSGDCGVSDDGVLREPVEYRGYLSTSIRELCYHLLGDKPNPMQHYSIENRIKLNINKNRPWYTNLEYLDEDLELHNLILSNPVYITDDLCFESRSSFETYMCKQYSRHRKFVNNKMENCLCKLKMSLQDAMLETYKEVMKSVNSQKIYDKERVNKKKHGTFNCWF